MRTILFILLNVIVTAAVVYVIIEFDLFGSETAESSVPRFATVEVIVTATPDPNATPLVRIITATPDANQIASLPTGIFDITPGAPSGTGGGASAGGISTIDPALLEADANLRAALGGSVLPDGCLLHTLEANESPGLLAVRYEASLDRILLVNGLDEDSARFLQIGQTLIIPLAGCPLEAVTVDDTPAEPTPDPNATPEDAPTETPLPTVTPTITLAPTAVNAQVEVREVVGRGDITAEAVIIVNNGPTVNITGWTLRDLDGNEYVFPEQRLFNDSSIEVFTRQGTNTPVRKFWGLSDAVWGEPGDVVILSNAEGVVQSILRLPSPVSLP